MTSDASQSSDSRGPFRDLGCWLNILAAILLVVYLAMRGADNFERDSWLRADPAERAEMAGDLIENHLTAGTSRKDVEAMLGKPSTEFPAGSEADLGSGNGAHTVLLYAIGPTADKADASALVVQLDANSDVIAALIR